MRVLARSRTWTQNEQRPLACGCRTKYELRPIERDQGVSLTIPLAEGKEAGFPRGAARGMHMTAKLAHAVNPIVDVRDIRNVDLYWLLCGEAAVPLIHPVPLTLEDKAFRVALVALMCE